MNFKSFSVLPWISFVLVSLFLGLSVDLSAQRGKHKGKNNGNHNEYYRGCRTMEAPGTLQHNAIFGAVDRYTVSYASESNDELLFDGIFATNTFPIGLLTISDLPVSGDEAVKIIGWKAGVNHPTKFTIEVLDASNEWLTIANKSRNNYQKSDFFVEITNLTFTDIRINFIEAANNVSEIDLAEIIYINSEIASPYSGLEGLGGGGIFTETQDTAAYFNGYVGIGTENPDAELTVAGQVHARRVRVDTDAGADFVFEPTYALPNLQDLELFVKSNRHLPGIQSEAEMIEEGIDLKELSIRLLQKVEELTLYTIEQEKRLKALEKQLQEK